MPRETPYPSYQDDHAEENKILKFPSTAGQDYAMWKTFFCDASTAHPAKANLALISWIIENYTSPGDVVVDPMAGTGSTIVVAMRKGRHGIAGEYEWRYAFSFLLHNIHSARTIGSFDEIGKGYTIIGDSRHLSLSIPEALRLMGLEDHLIDTTISSPPYVGLHIKKKFGGGKDEEKQWEEYLHSTGRSMKAAKKNIERWQDYGDDPENIGNMPKGSVDTVVLSPPYATTLSPKSGGTDIDLEQLRKVLTRRGHNPKQIKKILAGDASTTSVTMSKDARGYGLDNDNIGNLPHGSINQVITSPPYAGRTAYKDAEHCEERVKKLKEHPDSKIGGTIMQSPMGSSDPEQIDGKPYGAIDHVITSPPYSQALSTKAGGGSKEVLHGKGIVERGKKQIPVPYSEDEEQIGNLPHGVIDKVITSPPYEGSLEHRGGNQELGIEKGMTPYTADKENIGNMKEETYMQAMYNLYQDAWKYTKYGGLLILIVKNFVKHKRPVDLATDTINLAEMAGWLLMDRYYSKLADKSFWIIQHVKKFAKRLYMHVNGVPGVYPPAPVNPCAKFITTKSGKIRAWSDEDVLAKRKVGKKMYKQWQIDLKVWEEKYPEMVEKHMIAFRDTHIAKVKIPEGKIINWFIENECAHPWADYEDLLIFTKPTPKMMEIINNVV